MRLEPKETTSLAATFLFPLGAIAATLGCLRPCSCCFSQGPIAPFGLLPRGSKARSGSQFALFETLTRATPLIFTGLAVAVAFRAKLWNIGAEAQLYIGGGCHGSDGNRSPVFAGLSLLMPDNHGRFDVCRGIDVVGACHCSRPASGSMRWSPRCCSTS